MAVYSIGQMASSWVFGFWNQKTASASQPTICGLVITCAGNLLYGTLPLFSANRDWVMLFARLLVGFGSGNISVMRSYCATASTLKDRTRVMSLAVGAFTVGFSLGPAIQACFIPFGREGHKVLWLVINMYTAPAFLLLFVGIISMVMLAFFFEESYAGIIKKEEKKDPYMVVPKFDRAAAFTCIYLYSLLQVVETSLEVISTPLTMSLYNWNDSQALLYNGLLTLFSSSIDITNYILISFTRIGRIEKRLMLLVSLSSLIVYYLVSLPLPFYEGPLDYIELAPNSTTEDTSYSGGCYRQYDWCAHTKRIPLVVYVVFFIVDLGVAYPYMSAPAGIAFSEILGPRKQGMMQGIYEFGASLARCLTPLIQSYLFEHFGYVWPHAMNLALVLSGLACFLLLWRRIVPLKLKPGYCVPTRYKGGTFYRL